MSRCGFNERTVPDSYNDLFKTPQVALLQSINKEKSPFLEWGESGSLSSVNQKTNSFLTQTRALKSHLIFQRNFKLAPTRVCYPSTLTPRVGMVPGYGAHQVR